MPGKLEETEISEIPENSCIGHTIERNAIPTTHSAEISCGINYIGCAGIIDLAETKCNILTIIPHWGNMLDYQSCMGEAYMQIWTQLKEGDE
ncbi:MAG: hypothetical protein COB39_09250 [Marinosulfonomonas sp.]|nr:MAG: hypothetical protein COB39_09250 [Marinosulfonomonas sp.]